MYFEIGSDWSILVLNLNKVDINLETSLAVLPNKEMYWIELNTKKIFKHWLKYILKQTSSSINNYNLLIH